MKPGGSTEPSGRSSRFTMMCVGTGMLLSCSAIKGPIKVWDQGQSCWDYKNPGWIQGPCSKGFNPGVLFLGFGSKGTVPRVWIQGYCSKGSVSRVLFQGSPPSDLQCLVHLPSVQQQLLGHQVIDAEGAPKLDIGLKVGGGARVRGGAKRGKGPSRYREITNDPYLSLLEREAIRMP